MYENVEVKMPHLSAKHMHSRARPIRSQDILWSSIALNRMEAMLAEKCDENFIKGRCIVRMSDEELRMRQRPHNDTMNSILRDLCDAGSVASERTRNSAELTGLWCRMLVPHAENDSPASPNWAVRSRSPPLEKIDCWNGCSVRRTSLCSETRVSDLQMSVFFRIHY